MLPIATTKTTVLGIRLDHDRRAWVEDAAAREGLTVRAFFEQMIDEARADEVAGFLGVDVVAEPLGEQSGLRGLQSDHVAAGPDHPDHTDHPDGVTVPPLPAAGGRWTTPTPAPSLCDDVLQLVAVPRRLVEATASLTATVVRAGCRLLPRAALRIVRDRVPGSDLPG